jgi:phosphoglycerol transferase MdoB-like AlkP superfamily enzyme
MQLSRVEILELRFHTFSRHVLCHFTYLTTDANLLLKISFDCNVSLYRVIHYYYSFEIVILIFYALYPYALYTEPFKRHKDKI